MPSTDPRPRQNILVWGAYGFMGRHLVARLLETDADLAILTRERNRYEPAPWDAPAFDNLMRRFEATGGDPRPVFERAVASADLIFHFAGQNGAVPSNADPRRSFVENARATVDFLSACKGSKRRPHVVFASSRLVYGRTPQLPVAESHPVAPLSFYAANKLCCEEYHRAFADAEAITFTICRISNAFGSDPGYAHKQHGVINAFVERALAGEAIVLYGDGSQLRDYLYIDDLVAALLLCGSHPGARNECFNVGSGTGIRLRDAAEEIRRAARAPAAEFQPWPEDAGKVESGNYVSDISKIRATLGFDPVYSFAGGLAKWLEQRRGRPETKGPPFP